MPKHYSSAGKKKEGNAARYMTRGQALKHLQVNLNLFRRLCIVKGIFPREPKKKVKGNHHTYYHGKDISFLQHEPLLEKFTEIKTYQKKVKKVKAKKNEDQAIDRNEVLPLLENLEDPQNLLYAEAAEIKKKMAADEKQHHKELKKELTESMMDEGEEDEEASVPDSKQIAKDNEDMALAMMSSRIRKLYYAMKIAQERKKEAAERLKARKKMLMAAQE